MQFEVLPIIDVMLDIYQQPVSAKRFQAYLNKLQGGSKDDLILPIGGYNPMAKAQVIEKMKALKVMGTESIMVSALEQINKKVRRPKSERVIKVGLNLADDLKGGWTNRYTTDYDSKFKINALVRRNFCTPYFWSSEEINEALIIERTRAYALRTLYWTANPVPNTLKDHLEQEIFVAKHMEIPTKKFVPNNLETLHLFYDLYQDTDNYSLIFNFFYGDEASDFFGYTTHGISENTGFDYANFLALSTQ